MGFDVICEGQEKCTDYLKCTRQYHRTGIDKCVKPVHFQQYACDGDCTNCNHQNDCELILPYKEGLLRTQNRIAEIRIELSVLDEDYNYLTSNPQVRLYGVSIESIIRDRDELVEELRVLRLSEKKKIDLLRRRRRDML